MYKAYLDNGATEQQKLGIWHARADVHRAQHALLCAQQYRPPVVVLRTRLALQRAGLPRRSLRTNAAEEVSGSQPLFVGDSRATDPANNGVAMLIANWTGQSNSSVNFGQAYLWSSSVPKASDGAFNHRVSQLQLWSDFAYMVPPFLAYYGVMTANQSMVSEGYNQISLYRKFLRDTCNGSL